MGRFRAFVLLGIFCIPSDVYSQNQKAPSGTLENVQRKLEQLIEKHYPAATVVADDGEFSAKANTMQFTLHRVDRAGRISMQTHQEEGPKHNGLMLSVTRSRGRYRGPAVVPQTLRHPYWNSLINEIYDSKSDTHLWVIYSFGSQTSRGFHEAMLRTLGELPSKKAARK